MFFKIWRWGGITLETPTIENIIFLSSAMSVMLNFDVGLY